MVPKHSVNGWHSSNNYGDGPCSSTNRLWGKKQHEKKPPCGPCGGKWHSVLKNTCAPNHPFLGVWWPPCLVCMVETRDSEKEERGRGRCWRMRGGSLVGLWSEKHVWKIPLWGTETLGSPRPGEVKEQLPSSCHEDGSFSSKEISQFEKSVSPGLQWEQSWTSEGL